MESFLFIIQSCSAISPTYQWLSPSHQPDLLRPTPGKPHQQNLSTDREMKNQIVTPEYRVSLNMTNVEKLVDTPSPLPDMNSNRMSLSSFLGFLSLRTRLMGTLVLAAAGSCNIEITASRTRVFRKVNLRLHCVLSCFRAPITQWSVCTWETKSSCLLDLKKVHKMWLAYCKHYFSLFRRNLHMAHLKTPNENQN